MKSLLFVLCIFSSFIARAQFQSNYKPFQESIDALHADSVKYETVSTLGSGLFYKQIESRCTPRQNERVIWISNSYNLDPAMLVNGQVHYSKYGFSGFLDIPYVGYASPDTESMNLAVSLSSFYYPAVLTVSYFCRFELLKVPDEDTFPERTEENVEVFYFNMSQSTRGETDLIVDEVLISGDGISSDSKGGFIIKDSPAYHDGTITPKWKIRVKVKGVLNVENMSQWDYTELKFIAFGDDSGYGGWQKIPMMDIYRNGEAWVEWEESVPARLFKHITEVVVDVAYMRLITEVNYENNLKRFPVRMAESGTKISVNEVKLAQSVYNPYVAPIIMEKWQDLYNGATSVFTAVKDKSSSFEVNLSRTGTLLSQNSTYRVQVKDGTKILMDSGDRNVAEIPENGKFLLTADKMRAMTGSFIPSFVGTKDYSVEVVANSSEVESAGPMKVSVTTVKTYTPTIGLFKAWSLSEVELPKISTVKYNQFLNLSKYINSNLPVADGSVSVKHVGDVLLTRVAPKTNTDAIDETYVRDVIELEVQRRFSGLDRAVAVVSGSYFPDKLMEDWVGVNPGGNVFNKVMLVHEDSPTTVVHELMHSFGVVYELYPTKKDPNPPIVLVNGFDADPNGYLAGRLIENHPSVMDADSDTFRWVDRLTYGIAFQYLRTQEAKTQTTWVVGTLDANGNISNAKSISGLVGVPTASLPSGDLTIHAVDSTGKVLYTVTQSSSFLVRAQTSTGVVGSERLFSKAPFSVEFPADLKIAGIQVVKNNKKTSINLSGAKLLGELERLPLEAFMALGCLNAKKKNEFQSKERAALIKLAGEAQKSLDSGNLNAARVKLTLLIAQIKLTVNPRYVPTNSYNISRSTAIGVVQSTINSLSVKESCSKKGK